MSARLALLLPIALLAACDRKGDGAAVQIRSDNGSTDISALPSKDSRLKIDTPGVKADIDVPFLGALTEKMDIDGLRLYPNSKIAGIHIVETSRFRWKDGKPEAVDYDYRQEGALSWGYLTPPDERQRIMGGHMKVGHRFPQVRQLLAYSFGLALPFLLAAVAVERFISTVQRIRPYLARVSQISGVLLIVVGVMMMLDYFTTIGVYLQAITPEAIRNRL